MGSFSSKVRISRDNRNSCEVVETEVNEMGDGKTETLRHGETAKEGDTEIPCTSHEQDSPPPRVRQSFSWLVDTPVVLTTTAGKEKKAREKRCAEGKEKTSNVMKYNNGKYLKSLEHFADIPSPNPMSTRQPKLTEASSLSGKQNGESSKLDASKARKDTSQAKQENTNPATKDVVPSRSGGYRVGFGVDEARPTVNDGKNIED